jgi:hypothetical protein
MFVGSVALPLVSAIVALIYNTIIGDNTRLFTGAEPWVLAVVGAICAGVVYVCWGDSDRS